MFYAITFELTHLAKKVQQGVNKPINIFFFQNDPYYTCSLGQSPHMFIYSLFNVLALAEIKGYAMIQVTKYSLDSTTRSLQES